MCPFFFCYFVSSVITYSIFVSCCCGCPLVAVCYHAIYNFFRIPIDKIESESEKKKTIKCRKPNFIKKMIVFLLERMRLFTCTWWMCVVDVNWSCQQRDLSTYYDVVTLVLSTMEISFQMRLPHVHLRRKFCISSIDNRDEYLLCFEAKFIIKQNKNIELISTLMESEQIKSAEAMRHHCFQWLSSCRLHRILQRASVYRWSMITPPKKQLHFNEYSFDWFFFCVCLTTHKQLSDDR